MDDVAIATAVAGAALGGAWLGQRLRLPGGAIIGAVVAVAAVGLTLGWQVAPPEPLRLAAFVVIGWLLGESFDRDTRASLRRGAVAIGVAVVGMAVVAAATAAVLHLGFGLTPVTALLAATPGGLGNMTAVALSVPSSEPLTVATVHLARVLVVVTVVPLVLRRLQAREAGS